MSSTLQKIALLFALLSALGFAVPLDTVTLQLRWKHQFQFAGYYAAQEKGFFQKQGLFVKFRELEVGESAVDNVIFGKAEYGIQGADIIGDWVDSKPVVSLAVVFQSSPYVFITHPDITAPFQLQGKRVVLGNPPALEQLALLSAGGLSLDSVVQVHSRNFLEDFIRQDVSGFSAFLTNEPEILIQRKIEFNVIRPARYGIDTYGDAIFTSRILLEQNPEQVIRFVRATLAGWKYTLENQEEMVELVHRRYAPRLSMDHLRFEAKAISEMFDTAHVPLGTQEAEIWKQDARLLYRLGVISHIPDIDSYVYDLDRLEQEQKSRTIRYVSIVAGIAVFLAVLFSIFSWMLWRGMAKRNVDLRQSEMRLQRALMATSDSVWSWPNLDQPMWWSASGYEMMGLDPKQFVPSWAAFIERVHPSDRDELERGLQHSLDEGSTFSQDFRVLTGEIGGRWIRIRAIPLKNEEQVGFSGLFQDIHQLKTAEMALRESEARFRQYFELGLVGMATATPEGDFLQVNRTLWEMLESNESELLKENWKSFTHPGDLSLEEDLMDSVARGERQGFTIDKRFITTSKHIVYALVAMRAILDSAGIISHWVMLVQDITQRRQGEQEKEKILHQLSLKNRTLEGMLHTISHDFRHPLVNVMWFSQELERNVADLRSGISQAIEEIPYALKEIRHGAQVLDRMLTGMLALSRLGRQPPEFVHVEMKQVVQALLDEYKAKLEEHQVKVELDPLPACLGSEAMLYQVWRHLLNNAVQNHEPSRPLQIGISGKLVREWVVYSIDDNGIGIPASSLSHIFAPFFRLNPSASHQGEGLGLTFVTRILESHRGHIKVESELGKGSRFSIYLPQSPSAEHFRGQTGEPH